MLLMDLDDFKTVNDSHGHAVGDALLEAVGRRIAECIGPGDLAARLGGDEFALLLATSPNHAGAAARLLHRLGQPFGLDGIHVTTSVSIGIAEVPAGPGVSVDEVLREADVAMYAAKASGKDTLRRYSAKFDEFSSATAASAVAIGH